MSPGERRWPVGGADNFSTFPRNVPQSVQKVWKSQPPAAIRACPGPIGISLPLPRGAQITSVTLLIIAEFKNKKLQCHWLTTLKRGRQNEGKKKQKQLNK